MKTMLITGVLIFANSRLRVSLTVPKPAHKNEYAEPLPTTKEAGSVG